MRRIFLILSLLIMTSCNFAYIGCIAPTDLKREKADQLYRSYGARKAEMVPQSVIESFSCYYKRGDQFYTYSNAWESGYVLMRYKYGYAEGIDYVKN